MSAVPPLPQSSEVRATASTRGQFICLPGHGLTLTELLRALDLLRRRLALGTRGREGAFAGFDVLDVSGWQEGADDAHILFSARLVTDEGATQVVDYAASRCLHAAGACLQTSAEDVYVRASGRTVGLAGRRAEGRPAIRFSIASPHR